MEIIKLPRLPDDFFAELLVKLDEIIIPIRATRFNKAKNRHLIWGISKDRVTRKVGPSYATKKWPEINNLIMELCGKICPFPFTSVQLNHNVVCPKHRDLNNKGRSVLVSFGKYNGCNIVIEGQEYDTNHQPISFDGSLLEHWNSDFEICDDFPEPNKYSLVCFS